MFFKQKQKLLLQTEIINPTTVDRKHLMHFESGNAFLNFSGVVWAGPYEMLSVFNTV